ncbi:hypothetical protein [Paraclostridium sordellii]|uniref:hypothetical protein n=1 Tax=Paraclostridium sordellii TaxID=1505 RepID=UPI0018998F91|nr:hypothetical protein [Paeniclostridium sordellii]
MKKFFIIFIMIGTLGLVGCEQKEEVTINKDITNHKDQIKERLMGSSMGIYNINHLEKRKYKVSISMEGYKEGKLKDKRDILVASDIEVKSSEGILNIGINKNNKDVLVFDISQNDKDGFMASTSEGIDLSKYGKKDSGTSWHMIENDSEGEHKLELGKKFAIAAFSIGKDGNTYGVNLGNDFVKPSEKNDDVLNNFMDIIIYLKISKL